MNPGFIATIRGITYPWHDDLTEILTNDSKKIASRKEKGKKVASGSARKINEQIGETYGVENSDGSCVSFGRVQRTKVKISCLKTGGRETCQLFE